MFFKALSTKVKTWKQPICPLTEKWIKKMWYIHTMKYYSSIKNNEVISFSATWIDLEIIILSKIKSERERQVSDDITYMWNLKKKKDTIKLIYKIDSQTSKPNL